MGKVEVHVYEGIYDGTDSAYDVERKTLAAAPVDVTRHGNLAKKKGLRTGEGSTVTSCGSGAARQTFDRYRCGTLIDTITLHYCAALGLIEVGVLKKPDMWTYHRMIHGTGAAGSKNKKRGKVKEEKGRADFPPPKKVRDAQTNKEVAVFELLDDDDSDAED
jgi:hypothetical protein